MHRCEPYVYAQMIAGRDAPTHGEAKNSWLTGTAAWNMVAISQWILGIRPEHDGLRVEPVIPGSWTGFRATRRFRGTTYDIEVLRTGGEGAGGAAAIAGSERCSIAAAARRRRARRRRRPIEGTVIPLPEPGTPLVRVEARLPLISAGADPRRPGATLPSPPPTSTAVKNRRRRRASAAGPRP